jgi:hypothetical protein
MNKEQVRQLVKNNITALSDTIGVLHLIKNKSEGLTHYKVIDGRYYNKLTEAIPVTKTWYNDWKNEEVQVREYYIKGYEYSYGRYFLFEVYRDYDFNFSYEDKSKRYTNTYYIRDLNDSENPTTPQNAPELIEKLINELKEQKQRLIEDYNNIDNIIDQHNKSIKLLEELKEKEIKNYTVKKCMPSVQYPYVHSHYYITE